VDWGIDEALGRLISEQRARAAIGEGVRHPAFVPFRLTAIRDQGARERRGRRQALLVRRPAAAPETKATVP
jgi:hypothetical protein